MLVTVEHTCPVWVQVDTDTGEVVRVIVSDEDIVENIVENPDAFVDDHGTPVDDQAATEKALAIVRDSTITWPGWDFGW